jgi:Putative zincin peptidase
MQSVRGRARAGVPASVMLELPDHELAHQLFCRRFRIPVLNVCYFRFGNPAGFVIHEPATKSYQSVLISVGPFLVNTIIGAIFSFPAAIPVIRFGAGDLLDYFLIWLGVSIAMHAIPSTGDAKSMMSETEGATTEWENLDIGPQDPSLFVPPADFQRRQ